MSNKGQKIYSKAKKIIPNGNMLLSKRPENFLPNIWPCYFEETQGCQVIDLDGNKFIDVSLMGVGTNILGYSNKKVDEAVLKAIKKGTSCTLNCPEEVKLSENLLEINPWADMVRLARTGGELNAIAVRLARAATGKEKILISGYHGWHDWYLSSNLKDKDNLNQHLLEGLDPKGVPKSLKGTTLPFQHNNLNEFLKLISKHDDIAAVKMEVQRNFEPDKEFLLKVRKICTDKNIILIFDECTSGFRETFGGIFNKFNIFPDVALFSKALGNGYAICACVGIQSVMEEAKNTFLSSTFWTERIGPTAAIETLNCMKEEKSWEYISSQGRKIKNFWKNIFLKYQIDAEISGLDPLPTYKFLNTDHNKIKTLITYKMQKKGFLASDVIYVSVKHDDKILSRYYAAFEETLNEIEEVFLDIEKFKDFNVSEAYKGFQRIN